MSQEKYDVTPLTLGKRKLFRIAETKVVRICLSDLPYRPGSCASWIVGIVRSIEARDGLHQTRLDLRGFDQALALLLKGCLVKDGERRRGNARGDKGHDHNQKGYTLHCRMFVARGCAGSLLRSESPGYGDRSHGSVPGGLEHTAVGIFAIVGASLSRRGQIRILALCRR